MRDDPKKLLLHQHSCSRCFKEKEVVSFFFCWLAASGRYSLCEDCLIELQMPFKEKPQLDTGFFTVIKETIGIIKRYFGK